MARTMTAEGAWWLAKTYGIPAHWTVRSNEWRRLGFRFEVHGEIVARLAAMGWEIEPTRIERLPEEAEVVRAGAEVKCPRCGLAYINHLPISLVEARRERPLWRRVVGVLLFADAQGVRRRWAAGKR